MTEEETTPETTEEAAPDAAEEAPAPEAVEETPSPEEPEEAAPEAAEETPAPEESAEEKAAPAEKTSAPAPAPEAEPEAVLHPKERRKRARSAHSGEAGPERTVEERIADRAAVRARNAAERRRRRASVRSKKGEPGEGTSPTERVPGTKKTQQGTVVSDKADKTITVRVDIVRRHRRYEKVVRHSSTVHAHDEHNEAKAGDVVRVVESRPLSRLKRWRLVEVVEKSR